VFLLFFLSSFLISEAQLVRRADEAFEVGNYLEAIDLYSQLIDKNPDDQEFNERLGMSFLNTFRDPLSALDYLLEAERLGKVDEELYLAIAKASTFHLDYDQADAYLDKFEEEGGVNKKNKDLFDKLRMDIEAAQDLLKYPVDVRFVPAGEKINSSYPDYHPFITKDGGTLFFTTRRKTRPGDKPEFDGYYPSDIFYSRLTTEGWTKAEALPDPVNTAYDEQLVGITNSGDTIFFYIDHVDEFGDIFMSQKQVGIYSEPSPLKPVNSESIESACSISEDGNTILFSSSRVGGLGELDIYMVRKLPTGEWGVPQNLGPEINTPFSEDFPTLSGDGQTMYFCSNGHPGMGGYDLFFSTWDAQSKVWTKPQNIGYPINTPFDDKTISFTANGNLAYVTSIRPEGSGDLDVFEIRFNRPESTDPAIFLINIPRAAQVFGGAPEIVVKNSYDEMVGRYLPNKLSGRYVMALYPGKYFVYVDAKGFKPYTEVLVVNNYHTRQDQNVKIIKLEE
jgi:hypothetical protein